ncbi:hypothetical protein C0991_005451 [Blastosporella zonata]|nr:hypothetical protein C0991_005451 [Blastosporella zonata]
MSNSIAYLTSRVNFLQLSAEVPITKQRNPEKFDLPEVFDGAPLFSSNKKELVADLIVKAKQVEYLIKSLPEPELEEAQAQRLAVLEEEIQVANADYIRAVHRASACPITSCPGGAEFYTPEDLHAQVKEALLKILTDTDADVLAES